MDYIKIQADILKKYHKNSSKLLIQRDAENIYISDGDYSCMIIPVVYWMLNDNLIGTGDLLQRMIKQEPENWVRYNRTMYNNGRDNYLNLVDKNGKIFRINFKECLKFGNPYELSYKCDNEKGPVFIYNEDDTLLGIIMNYIGGPQ